MTEVYSLAVKKQAEILPSRRANIETNFIAIYHTFVNRNLEKKN